MSLLKDLLKEDWGSSDWYGVIKRMDEYLDKKGMNPENIRQAASNLAEFYSEPMGYGGNWKEAEDAIIAGWLRISKRGQALQKMFATKESTEWDDIVINEEAAEGSVSAGDVAGVREPLGSEPTEKVKVKKKKKKKTSLLKRMALGERMEQKFDQADVVSKLKAAEKSAMIDKDTVAFGLEDEAGGIVKVHVRADQADEFQDALETALAGEQEGEGAEETGESTSREIADVLFELKDKFEIVDVEWGAIPEDEEENQEVEGEGDELGLGDEGEGDELGDEELGDEEMVADDELGDEEDAKTALTQVIDMMKADAEAKKAEAEAKKAEADAKSAEYAAQAAAEKVKQEEEILDMEAYNKAKADEEKEAKRLAQLAKYKHDMAGEAGAGVEVTKTEVEVAPEEEEKTLSVDELTDLLRRRLQAN